MNKWTISQLQSTPDHQFAVAILNERLAGLNPNAPLAQKIAQTKNTIANRFAPATPCMLLEFAFMTGDESCRFCQHFVVIQLPPTDNLNGMLAELGDSIIAYMEAHDDPEYDDAVEAVMDTSGFAWHWFKGEIRNCVGTRTLWI